MTLITTNTSTNAATSDFTSGIDSTYKLYIFKFYGVNPVTNGAHFSFQANAAGASGYNETMTTTQFYPSHYEDDTSQLLYHEGFDQAQGTAFQGLAISVGSAADESCAGELWLFNPSNTTYVKHFHNTVNTSVTAASDRAVTYFNAGYFNTTTAIDDIQFKMSTGNMDAVIKMYGVG